MAGAPDPRLIIDFDKKGSPSGPNLTLCDYLLIAEGKAGCGWVVPLELQRGCLEAGKVVKQLQAGARIAEKLISSEDQIKFRPVAVSRSRSMSELKKLRNKNSRIRLHGRKEIVRLASCDAPLTQTLDS